MKDFSLYVILDKELLAGREVACVAGALAKGGADLIQYRNKSGAAAEKEKEAAAVREALKETGALYIVNDDPRLAARVAADGVHLGQDDVPVREAREILGKGKVIGVSARSIAEAQAAEEAGADYIAVGDLFGTLTKPGAVRTPLKTLREIAGKSSIPVVGVGGIHLSNVAEALEAGASAVAVSRAVLAGRDVAEKTRALKEKIEAIKERRGA